MRRAITGLLVLAVAATAGAVEVLGDLQVEVLSALTDKPVAGVTVTVRDRDGARPPQTATTDEAGLARFERLLTGDYAVEVAHDEYENQELQVRVAPDTVSRFQVLMIARGEETVVKVVRDRLLVNRSSPVSTTRRDSRAMERISGRDSVQSVVSTVPGIQTNSVGQLHARGEHKSVSLSIDGVNVPIPASSSTSQIVDPRFLEQLDVQTGGYDASVGGQTGAVLNLVTRGARKDVPVEVIARGGNVGQVEGLIRAAGANQEGTFDYFVGARAGRTDLRLEPPHPDQQTLNNTGTDTSLLVRFHGKTEDDDVGLTLSHQDGELGVPQTPQNFAAGVRQDQFDRNTLAVLSWRHRVSEPGELLLGLAYLNTRQRVRHNGVFTNWTPVDPAVEEELAEEGFPADPQNPGSPYLPTTDLTLRQFQPSLEYTHRLGDRDRVKVGVTADFIRSQQLVDVFDLGGGG
ncbi:MAG: TonB-dependent receptor, partial [Candidatus Eremiobacterota bacterium]